MVTAKKHLSWSVPSLILLLFVLHASVSLAQMGMMRGPSPLAGLFHPKVGAGSAYLVTDSRGQTSELDMSVVGKEEVDATTAYWFEIAMSGSGRPGGDMVMKYLIAPQASGVKLYRIIMKNPEMGTMEMPETMASRMGQSLSQDLASSEKDMGKNLGTEVIMTKLGPKKCTHLQKQSQFGTTDVWIADDVYPTALVKSVTRTQSGTHSMELIREITNAKTRITEPPQKMAFPPQPPGR